MELNYYNRVLSNVYRQLTSGAVMEVYLLPNEEIVCLLRVEREGFLLHACRHTLTQMEGTLYRYPSSGHAAYALIHWEPSLQAAPLGFVGIEAVNIAIERNTLVYWERYAGQMPAMQASQLQLER